MILKKGVNIVLDGQWGSTGKGKLCGMLGLEQPDIVMSSFGPNAGHTYVGDYGEKVVFKHLPSSACTAKSAKILIMPDSVINVDTFMNELAYVDASRVMVHPRAAIVTPEDASAARVTGKYLAGTMQGTGHAIAKKILRLAGTRLAQDVLPARMVGDTCAYLRKKLANPNVVALFEMSQGWDLSINHGLEFPYLTSRDITIGAALNSMGISYKRVAQLIGSIRTNPIRVGNIEGGYSGGCWPDQHELTWNEVTQISGSEVKFEEKTTVTKRVRRVFTFSPLQVKAFCDSNEPDMLFLNFAQYVNATDAGKTTWEGLSEETRNFVKMVEETSGVKVGIIGTGAKSGEVVVK